MVNNSTFNKHKSHRAQILTQTFLVAFVLILSVVMLAINVVWAWFTDGSSNDNKQLIAYIKTSETPVYIYQEFSDGSQTKLTNDNNIALKYTSATNNKVVLDGVNNLKLVLKNEDLGVSFCVRYKVEFYASTASGKVLLSSSISGMTAPSSGVNGFVLDNGWYYYRNNSGANTVLNSATSSSVYSVCMMTSFTISSDETVAGLLGGNSIYMSIAVENVAI